MRISRLIFCFAVTFHGLALGAEKPRAYEAIVDAEDGANVWSGPDSKKHYPTTRLNKGDRVKVIRTDPGGWCVIEPPAGSHSWVRAKYIDKDGSNHGVVNSNRVKVHVGSEVNPDNFLTYQAELSKGDVVEILGERDFSFDDVSHRMLKISPVKREWRWIRRKSIVAVDSIKPDPFPSDESNPKKPGGPVAENDSDVVARPVSSGGSAESDREESISQDREINRNEPLRNQQPGKQRLAEIDYEFHEMIKKDKETWNLDMLEDLYQQLEDEVSTPWMKTEIARRMDAVKRYRKTYNAYMDFIKLTADARQRDAELSALQTQSVSRMASNSDQRIAAATADTQSLMPQPIQPTPAPQPSVSAPSQPGPRAFDGAGIVTRLEKTFPGGPQYVLMSPDGKALCFLQPGPGVDLNRYHGRAMGIVGQRSRREEWSSDVIVVRNLQPVQLRGTR